MADKNIRTARICSHTIEYWWQGNDIDWDGELSQSDEEHIQKMLLENYVAGELCTVPPDTDEEVYGWWQIRRN